ncbi:unannotated protein [freshwater metagenome]|uniref:Unannotated protein n=1 Tax=freshwater metagenome TaxID=449393 RepID=A0A6J7DBX0_9ZZZZ|nr:hypothetical protein [Actinomycetota bacterium]
MRRRSGRRGRGAGFTLVELVVMIAITGVITTSLVNGIVVVLRSNVAVSTRTDDSGDLLQLATWFPQDVNSTPAATAIGTGVELGDLTAGCATADVGVGLLRLTWSEQTGTGATDTYRVSYRSLTTGTVASLLRVSCKNFGTASTNTASRSVPLFADGSLPFTLTAVGSTVTMSVTQHAGTSAQKVVQIDAVSRNPSIATLPDAPAAPPPSIMTLSTDSVDAGNAMTAEFSRFAASEAITVYLDYTHSTSVAAGSIGSGVADSSGSTTGVRLSIPLSAVNGPHQVFAIGNAGSFVAGSIWVNNGTIELAQGGVAQVTPGATIDADVHGFDVNDLVTFLLDSNTVIGTVTVKHNTPASALLVPVTTSGGLHVISAIGTSGRRAVSGPFTVLTTLALLPTTVPESMVTSAVVYGFHAGEAISYHLDSATGAVLATSTADMDGYNHATLTIPPFTTAGAHVIEAVGDGNSSGAALLNVTTSVRAFTVTPNQATVTAGGYALLTLQATINGVNDPTLTGAQPIVVSGPSNSPNGRSPATFPSSATFVAGTATISVNLVNAIPTKITVTDIAAPVRTGESLAMTVTAAPAAALAFAVACPQPITNNWNSGVTVSDQFGNVVSGAAVTLTFSPAIGSNASVRALSGWPTITANIAYGSVTNASGSTASFTATGPTGNGHKPSVLVTASTAALSTSCTVTS